MLEKDPNFTPLELDSYGYEEDGSYSSSLPSVIGWEEELKVSPRPQKFLSKMNSWVIQDDEDLPLESGYNHNFENSTFLELNFNQESRKTNRVKELTLMNPNNKELRKNMQEQGQNREKKFSKNNHPDIYNTPQVVDKNEILWMCVLNNHGGRTLPLIRFRHEIWRFITSIFLHVSKQHLMGNLLFTYFLLEILKIHASQKALKNLENAFLAGFLANMLSGIPNYDQLGVGFSPVVYSILGIVLTEGVKLSYSENKFATKFKTQEMLIVLICLAFGLASNSESCDVTSHFLGLVFGSVLTNFSKYKIRGKLLFVGVIIMTNLSWIYFCYGGLEEEIAASFNMGCNYSKRN